MPLPASGTIKLSEIASQFGGSGPHKLSEYYRGGSFVKNTSINANIATSGTNKIKNFYSTENPNFNIISEANTSFDSETTINTNSTNRGANTSIVILFASSVDNSSQSMASFTCKNGSTNASIPSSYLRQANSNRGGDGHQVVVQSFKIGDISSVKIQRSGGSGSGTKSHYVFQWDGVGTLDSNLVASTTRLPVNGGPADEGFTSSCNLTVNTAGRFVCVGFSSKNGNFTGINNTTAVRDIDGGIVELIIGYDQFRDDTNGTINYQAQGQSGRAMLGVAFAF